MVVQLVRSLVALAVFAAVALSGFAWAEPAPPPMLVDAAPGAPLLCVPLTPAAPAPHEDAAPVADIA